MTPTEWQKHLEDTRFHRSRPSPHTGEVTVYRYGGDGELRFDHVERPAQDDASSSFR